MTKALILVDLQNDFVPGGALAVPNGDELVPLVNRLEPHFDVVVATQDWHPANHGSFAVNHSGKRPGDVIEWNGLKQILWPVHCVQGTPGASFVASLDFRRVEKVFQKGTDPGIDSYSGFFDNGQRKATGLADYLKGRRVTELFLAGLATDYCVKFTALDAREIGYRTCLIVDACRGVELRPGDVAQAIADMRAAGVEVVASGEILRGARETV